MLKGVVQGHFRPASYKLVRSSNQALYQANIIPTHLWVSPILAFRNDDTGGLSGFKLWNDIGPVRFQQSCVLGAWLCRGSQ